MRNFFLGCMHGLGAMSALMVFIFLAIRAFGQVAMPYNDAVALLAAVGLTWAILCTVRFNK